VDAVLASRANAARAAAVAAANATVVARKSTYDAAVATG